MNSDPTFAITLELAVVILIGLGSTCFLIALWLRTLIKKINKACNQSFEKHRESPHEPSKE